MKSLMIAFRLITASLFALGSFSSLAFAVPGITNINGTLTHGGSVTITGTAFGAKPTPAPYIWDPMETSFNNAWASTHALSIQSGGTRHANSVGHAYVNMDTYEHSHGQVQAPGSPLSDTWFAQYWVYFGNDWEWGTTGEGSGDSHLANLKLFRLWNPADVNENFVVAFAGWEGSYYWSSVLERPNGGGVYGAGDVVYGIADRLSLGRWHLLEFAYKENSALGANDGKFEMWLDGESLVSTASLVTRVSFAGYKRPLILGWDSVWAPSPGEDLQSPNTYRMDDMYLDTSWARVEIGNAATRSACTHREIQIPSSWNATSITATVNQGAFSAGQTAYLYVIDQNGAASPGRPVVFSGQPGSPTPTPGDTTPPSAPSNLRRLQ